MRFGPVEAQGLHPLSSIPVRYGKAVVLIQGLDLALCLPRKAVSSFHQALGYVGGDSETETGHERVIRRVEGGLLDASEPLQGVYLNGQLSCMPRRHDDGRPT